MGTHIGRARADQTLRAPGPDVLHRVRLILCLAVMGWPLANAASAQSSSAPTDECAAAPTPAEEIACLRRALKEKTDALAARSAPAPARKEQPAAPARAQADPAAPPTPAAEPRRADPPVLARASEELGREQLQGDRRAQEDRSKESGLQALVVSAQEDREGLFRIALGNGQVWKQVERPSVQIVVRDDRQYPVEITRSGFGGYRMYFADLRRSIVVKRLQ